MGYDSPASRDEDLLGRWPFAEKVARLAADAPDDWAVRIGIYGGWGDGKTTVLKMVKTIGEEQGQLVVEFNPWAATSSVDLWWSFLEAVRAALESSEVPRLRALAADMKRGETFKRLADLANGAAELHDAAKAAAGVGLPILQRHLGARRDRWIESAGMLAGGRVLVLIDDLDRTDPTLLPQLLFSLHQLLDIPRFSFVLAVDPERVGEVLGAVNPGWSDGQQFLKKIVDFPMHLPCPTTSALERLAESAARRALPEIPGEVAAGVTPLLFQNPRDIKQFFRLASKLRLDIDRHDSDELDWEAILLAQVLRQRWPDVARRLFSDPQDFARIVLGLEVDDVMGAGLENLSSFQGKKYQKLVGELECPPKGDEAKQLTATLLRFDSLRSRIAGEALYYFGNLGEGTVRLTRRELETFVSLAMRSPLDARDVAEWLADQAQRANASEFAVLESTARLLNDLRTFQLTEANNAYLPSTLQVAMTRSAHLLDALAVVLREIDRCGEAVALSRILVSCMEAFRDRAGDTGAPPLDEARAKEREFLLHIVSTSKYDVVAMINGLKPFDYYPFDMNDQRAPFRPVFDEVLAVVEAKAAGSVVDRILSGVNVLVGPEVDEGLKYVFLSPQGSVWKGKHRSRMIAFFKEAPGESAAKLAFELLRSLPAQATDHTDRNVFCQGAQALLADAELMATLVSAAFSQEPCPKYAAYARETVLPRLIEAGASLPPLPEWLQ